MRDLSERMNNHQLGAMQYTSFGKNNSAAAITKPIQKTQETIESGVTTIVDTFETERKKKSYKRAVVVGTGVTFIGIFAALLNPRTSAKTIEKLKMKREAIRVAIEKTKKGSFANKWYKFKAKLLDIVTKLSEVGNNINNGKDIVWKNLCCEEKKVYTKIKCKPVRKVLQGLDKGFIFLMKKPHEAITNLFGNFTKKTVLSRYKKSLKESDKLDAMIKVYIEKYKNKLSTEELKILEQKCGEIVKAKEYFSSQNIESRLAEQERIMKDLEKNVVESFSEYGKKVKQGFKNKNGIKTAIHDLNFFSETILKPEKQKLSKQGNAAVGKLVNVDGNGNSLYSDVVDVIKKQLNESEQKALEKKIQSFSKSLKHSNTIEVSDYFDKKRDLVLGSAPTDVVSVALGLSLAGISVGVAKDKEQRINRAIAVGAPAIIGVGTSLYLTSKLFTGFKNMVVSGLIGFVVSKIGSVVANAITGQKDEIVEDGEPFLLMKDSK